MKTFRVILIAGIFGATLFGSNKLSGHNKKGSAANDSIIVSAIVHEGDTLPFVQLPEVKISAQ